MNVQRLALAVCFVLGLAIAAHADEKKDATNKEKILGTWLGVEGPEHIKGATIKFAKDGKATVTHKQDDKTVTEDFKYEVDGETITVIIKDKDGNEQTMKHKIKSLTDKEMVAENDKGEVAKFKKKTD
jgi:uncharacterized protein (TIGR03066 family)